MSFTFDVQVGDVVEPLQVFENTIQADWTSLPGQDTALNSTGLIGADGAVDGMRIGALPNAGNTLNDYEAEASDSVYVPPLEITKTDLDPALPPEIGAHKSFQVQIDLPEGVSNDVSLADELATGGVSYCPADNVDFDVTYEFVGITSINGQAPDEAAFMRCLPMTAVARSPGTSARSRPRSKTTASSTTSPLHPCHLLRAHQQRPRHRRRRHPAELGDRVLHQW